MFKFVRPSDLAVASMCAFCVEEFDNPVIRDLGYFCCKGEHFGVKIFGVGTNLSQV